MAKRSKNTQWGQRDILTQIARPVLLAPMVRLETSVSPMVEDRRTYNPLGEYRPPLTIAGGRTSIVPATPAKKAASASTIPSGVAFSDPTNVNICRRRKTRREVLAAKKLFKKGSGAGSRRRNIWSEVSC